MPDLRFWSDAAARQGLMEQGRAALERLAPQLRGREGVVAVEPESGDWFVGPTLGQANDAAFAQYPDRWLYFCRLDDSQAEIVLPTW
jgi:hypothetical protein